MIFGLMNIVAAVIHDALAHVSNLDRDTTMHERNAKEKAHLQNLRELLWNKSKTLDPDGKISRTRLMKILRSDGAQMLRGLGVQLGVAKALFNMLDVDEQQVLEIDEFIYGLSSLKGNPTTIRLTTLMHQNKKLLYRLRLLSVAVEDQMLPILKGVDPQMIQ